MAPTWLRECDCSPQEEDPLEERASGPTVCIFSQLSFGQGRLLLCSVGRVGSVPVFKSRRKLTGKHPSLHSFNESRCEMCLYTWSRWEGEPGIPAPRFSSSTCIQQISETIAWLLRTCTPPLKDPWNRLVWLSSKPRKKRVSSPTRRGSWNGCGLITATSDIFSPSLRGRLRRGVTGLRKRQQQEKRTTRLLEDSKPKSNPQASEKPRFEDPLGFRARPRARPL